MSTQRLILPADELRPKDVILGRFDDGAFRVEREVADMPVGTIVHVKDGPNSVAVVVRQPDGHWYNVHRPSTNPWYRDQEVTRWVELPVDTTHIVYQPEA